MISQDMSLMAPVFIGWTAATVSINNIRATVQSSDIGSLFFSSQSSFTIDACECSLLRIDSLLVQTSSQGSLVHVKITAMIRLLLIFLLGGSTLEFNDSYMSLQYVHLTTKGLHTVYSASQYTAC